ncbi:MAG: phospholipid-binding lipoprotein MlaA [Halioglobus sp.]|jgi:phospholipid-binding lipoprotein MlaA
MSFVRCIVLMLLLLPMATAAAMASDVVLETGDTNADHDPWEPMNRQIFVFNDFLDKYLLRPVAVTYHTLTPDILERGVTNFVLNVRELNNIFNSILQGDPENAIHTTGRFLVNTTVGLGGLFDVASPMGVEHRPADFGQTLSIWGVGSGPYVMLPILGPRYLRSSAGEAVDVYATLPTLIDRTVFTRSMYVVDTVDTRARLLDAEKLISGDRYIFTREVYMQRREYFLSGGVVDDSFSEFEEGDYEEF